MIRTFDYLLAMEFNDTTEFKGNNPGGRFWIWVSCIFYPIFGLGHIRKGIGVGRKP